MWYSEIISGAVVLICALLIMIAGLSSELFKLRRLNAQLRNELAAKK